MGQEEEAAARLEAFKDFQINDGLVAHAKKDYMFLHCLPAHREEEVATSVIDGPNSYVFQQAGIDYMRKKQFLLHCCNKISINKSRF